MLPRHCDSNLSFLRLRMSFRKQPGILNFFAFSCTLGPSHLKSHSSNINVLLQFHTSLHSAHFLYLSYWPYLSPKGKFCFSIRVTTYFCCSSEYISPSYFLPKLTVHQIKHFIVLRFLVCNMFPFRVFWHFLMSWTNHLSIPCVYGNTKFSKLTATWKLP